MFLQFYGLREHPFGVTPDPRFLYLSPSHREAIASLYCSIENGRGFSSLIAKPGMGKTSILFRLLETLRSRARTAFLFQSDCNSQQLFQSLLLDLGLEVTGDLVRMRESLNRLLLEERIAGRHFVVVVDEAQNLSAEALESIRLLSNFETPTEKLIHIVLAGQPQLATTLARPDMVQLSQRVSSPIRLAPFSLEETKAYILHRLSVAGRSGSDLFTDDAYALIALLSEGIPRNISSICFQAMSIGCALRIAKIHPGIIAEVANDLRASSEAAPASAVSLGAPVTDPSWSVPELSRNSLAPPQMPLPRRRLWKFGLAMSALVLVSLLAWSAAFSRWKLELTPKSEFIQPVTDGKISPAEATAKSVETASSTAPPDVIPSRPTASVAPDGNAKPSETLSSSTSPTATNVTTSTRPHTISAFPAIRTKEVREHPPMLNVARKQDFPRVIYLERSESLFQVALENYGKSNRELVYRIQVENPSLTDPFMTLYKGQRLVLPELPAADRDRKQN
jgi:type II secretory pathway predicted ATPase ExeA